MSILYCSRKNDEHLLICGFISIHYYINYSKIRNYPNPLRDCWPGRAADQPNIAIRRRAGPAWSQYCDSLSLIPPPNPGNYPQLWTQTSPARAGLSSARFPSGHWLFCTPSVSREKLYYYSPLPAVCRASLCHDQGYPQILPNRF